MGNLLSNSFNFHGDKVKLSFLEILLYGLIPNGPLAMRVLKLNGSLDKWYLLPLDVPPFSFIQIYMAKWGFIKGINNVTAPPIDFFVLIPIIIRFILILLLDLFSLGGILANIGIIYLAIFFANLLHTAHAYSCSNSNTNIFHLIKKNMGDSAIQLSGGVLATFLIQFIPGVDEAYDFIQMIPFIGPVCETLLWSCGYIFFYLLGNMYDINFEPNSLCNPKSSTLRFIIGFFALCVSILYQGIHLLPFPI